MDEKYILENTIYRVRHGSMAYGTNIPGSDVDEKGICIIPDDSYYFGFNNFEQKDKGWEDGNDRVIYDIRKFIKLALDCNPSIIEILFVDEKDILHIDAFGKLLRDKRDIFLSRKAASKFMGYALSQLHRIQNHKVWQEGELKEPKEEDFVKTTVLEGKYLYGIPYGDPIDNQQRDNFKIELDNHIFTVNQPFIGSDGEDWLWSKVEIKHFDKQALKVANKKYSQYLHYMENRNPKRAELEKNFGYDTKHGLHLIRLLRMGVELIRDGRVIVRRPDKDELLDIRNGKVEYPKLIEMAEKLKTELNEALPNSPLPEEPDTKAAHDLLIKLVKKKLKSKEPHGFY